MADLRLDDRLLDEAAASARAIAREFSRAAARREASASVWGADDVRDAMETFESSWDRRRRLLSEDLEEFSNRIETTSRGFDETDEALRGSFDRPPPPPPVVGRWSAQ